jgi:hypothetical protein
MTNDPIRGKTLRFHFRDGQMANKTFEHRFADDGTLTFSAVSKDANAASAKGDAKPVKYEVARIRDDVYAVSYRSDGGYTLTTILDMATKKLVAFASSDKMLEMQSGTFEYGETQARSEHARHAIS